MHTKPATRYSPKRKHQSYGIYKWFASKGIKNQQIIMEVMANFCIYFGVEITRGTSELELVTFCQSRFYYFPNFATKFLTDNNYL